MPESEALELTAEDVSQLTWDELVLVMVGKDRAAGEAGAVRATYIPPCTTNCCTYSEGCSGCSCLASGI
jgi:hypothetical protein